MIPLQASLPNTQAISIIFISSLLTFGFFLAGLYLPVLIFIPIWVIVYVGISSHSYLNMLITSVISVLIVSLVFGLNLAMFFITTEINIAFIVLYLINKENTSSQILSIVTGYLSIIFVLFWFTFSHLKGQTPATFLFNELSLYLEKTQYPLMLKEHKQVWQNAFTHMKDFFFPIMVIWFTVSFALSYHIAYHYFKRMKILLPSFFIHPSWRPNEKYIYGLIAGIGLSLFAHIYAKYPPLLLVGKNIVFLFGSLYVITGMTIIRYLLLRMKINTLLRFAFYAVIFLQPSLLIGTGILGIADVWINIRDRINKKDISKKQND